MKKYNYWKGCVFMKYGLVLSGGGSKGAYESGCMKALQ